MPLEMVIEFASHESHDDRQIPGSICSDAAGQIDSHQPINIHRGYVRNERVMIGGIVD
jgi:hypothetical protein